MTFCRKRILIFGGTGSLGRVLARTWLMASRKNIVYVFSRDENKQWQMKQDFRHPDLRYIVGNVSDAQSVRAAIRQANPHIIISAAAMKHIDICEANTRESIQTNIIGTQNILESIASRECGSEHVETVLLVSTDKACSPVNNYGMCKAISETLFVESALRGDEIKYVVVRYGNVLDSRGSILPLLRSIGKDASAKSFRLTDERMTRFVMTLEESVRLIEYAIQHGHSGEIIVPELRSMRIRDLLDIFASRYNKPVELSEIRPGEKLAETLVNDMQAMRTVLREGYLCIQSMLAPMQPADDGGQQVQAQNYTSDMNLMDRNQLEAYLDSLNLL